MSGGLAEPQGGGATGAVLPYKTIETDCRVVRLGGLLAKTIRLFQRGFEGRLSGPEIRLALEWAV